MDIKQLYARARREGTPLIDGKTATFLWKGRHAPSLMGDWTDWDAAKLIELDKLGSGLWGYSTTFPRDAYLEYAFISKNKRRIDPCNATHVDNGVGRFNQFFYMPDAAPAALTRRTASVSGGKVTSLIMEGEGLVARNRRTVYFYQPPVQYPVPLLVVFDGADYLRRGHLTTIVDNLIAEGRIQPIALAMIHHGGPMRFVEYACNESVIAMLVTALLPLARATLNLVDLDAAPGSYGIMGASLGGLIALYAALRLPQAFGRVLCQSGAFSMESYDAVVYDLVRDGPRRPLHIWMDCGRFEGLVETNRRMHRLLQEKEYAVTYHEQETGHNFTAWRNDVGNGLETLFGAV
ncbi:MAG: alpha/beta hydrolase-fold protein [Anaerolineae bacterium]